MLMLRFGLALVVSMFLGARIVVSGVQMKRGMSVAAGESERQDQDQATQQQGSLHGASTYLRRIENRLIPHSTRPLPGEAGPGFTLLRGLRGNTGEQLRPKPGQGRSPIA